MHLATVYAPGSFLKPCVLIDTLFNSVTKETALIFADALNCDHARQIIYADKAPPHSKRSDWVVIQEHATQDDAISFHVDLAKHFHNGGSQEEWDEGWEPYLALYSRWCPTEMRDNLDTLGATS